MFDLLGQNDRALNLEATQVPGLCIPVAVRAAMLEARPKLLIRQRLTRRCAGDSGSCIRWDMGQKRQKVD